MINTIECPHCGKQAEYIKRGEEYWGTCEEIIKCECGYYYEFAYGYYREDIPGKVAVFWSYADPTRRPVPLEEL